MREKRRFYFSDETENFRRPAEPAVGEEVVIRLRGWKASSFHAWVRTETERLPMALAAEEQLPETHAAPVESASPEGNGPELDADEERPALYEVRLPGLDTPFRYVFEIQDAKGTVYYDKQGVRDRLDFDQAFTVIPGFSVPEWVKGAVIYQIFVDRFRNGDPSNDVEDREYAYLKGGSSHRVTDWETLPEQLDVRNFYGGDLQGVWEKLDYLQYLGVEVLYFNPLFVSPSNHKYDTQDYDHIDPHLAKIAADGGEVLPEDAPSNSQATRYIKRTTDPANLEASDAFFAALVQEAHRRGMRVILDGVFNHCGSFHKWMDREGLYHGQPTYRPGAYGCEESPYRSYFRFGQREEYECWWGFETLPKLNYEGSAKLWQEVMDIGAKWVSAPYCADGWRLDVAADLGHSAETNHRFWREFRRSVKEANPEAVILAEHYGDISAWMDGTQWDTVMNYDAFMEPVSWFLTSMEKHSDEYKESLWNNGETFWKTMTRNMARFPYGSLHGAMNQLDNHDHSRFVTRTSRRVGRLASAGSAAASQNIRLGVCREAAVLQMTWPGAPTLYYGDETALCGWTDPDCRRTFPWGKENWEMIEFYRDLIHLHKQFPALRKGSLVRLAAGYQLVAYGRFLGEERLVVVIHNGEKPREVELQVSLLGGRGKQVLVRQMETWEEGYNVGEVRVEAPGGFARFTMRPASAAIFLVRQEEEKHV